MQQISCSPIVVLCTRGPDNVDRVAMGKLSLQVHTHNFDGIEADQLLKC